VSDTAVITEQRGGGLWARLHRPDSLNSLNPDIIAGLERAMDEAVSSSEIHALVITGSGRAFCAGADLEFLEGAAAQEGARERFLGDVGVTFRRLERLPMPTIAAINGFAVAGGLEIVLCCDMAIAAESAKIGDAHANYGLIPGGGGTVRLPRRVGPALAKQLMFTGAMLPAGELRHSGLLNDVVPADGLEATVDELVAVVAKKSTLGLARVKALADDALEQPIDTALRAELAAFAAHENSADLAEGLAAFREKRQPRFTGR
jgi:enoyl-CoA hydratase/carnithine racemase